MPDLSRYELERQLSFAKVEVQLLRGYIHYVDNPVKVPDMEMINRINTELEEGDACPNCTGGRLRIPPARNCSCHMGHPPCSACTDRRLTCDNCGYECD